MKKLLLLLFACAFVCAAASAVFATDVVVSATTIPNANFSNIGQDRQLAVTVTSGSPTVTSGSLFAQYVGKRGFTLTIGGTRYVVANVADANTLTLTTNHVGLTGSTTAIWHKFVEVRLYSSASFRPKGKDYIVPQGTPGSGEFYLRFYASVIVEDAVSKLFLPQFTVDATTDATVSTAARYTIVYYRPDGSEADRYRCAALGNMAVPPGSPTSLADICSYNASAVPVPDNQTYTREEIDRRVPRCTANQMIYYASSGNAQNCLSLDLATLQISGGTLSVIGGGGGGIGGSGTTNSVPYFTNSNTVAASNLIYSTASQLFQFGYSIDIQAGGLSKLTLETDQIIFQGGVSRANNSIMQAMKATASQTGPFQRFTESTGSIRFEVDIDGDVKPRGVNYTWPLTSSSGAMLNTSGTLSWVPFNSSYFSTSGSITPKGLAGAINPKTDHGCVGDDVADDTTCLVNAIAAAVASTGKTIKLDAGTYRTTAKLTVPGGVTIIGDGREKTIIHGTANDTILDLVPGTGVFLYRGPTITDITVRGSNSGSNQIGIKVDASPYFEEAKIEDVIVRDVGSHGVYFGYIFSSTFKRIYSSAPVSGYPFLFDQLNMPGNTFEGLYAQDVNTSSPAGFRIRSGNITCWGCNGINNSGSNSWWAIVGDKIGVDGAASNRAAYLHCIDCNIESSKAGGILHYYNSRTDLDGLTLFAGDASAAGTYIALKYEVDSSLFPPYFQKGHLSPSTTFANSPLSYYANSEVIHANDLPPVAIDGAVRQADGAIISTYYNTALGRSEAVYRVDGARPVTTITASTVFTNPGATNFEANCGSNCTLTLPWPGWYTTNTDLIHIRNIGAGTLTINANSGGSINGGASYPLAQFESAVFMPHTASADFRLVGVGGSGVANRVTYWSDTQKLTSSANFTYNGTTLLLQRSGGNPYLAINDISAAGINTRFGPLAGAPDRAIIGTTSNHPFGLYANNAERWTVGTSGPFTPGASNSYDIGSTTLPVRTGYFGTSLNVGIGGGTTGQIVLNNSSNTNTTTLQPGAPSSSIAITLPATLPASAGCLQISSTGVITQTGSACGGGGGGTPAWSDITAPMAGLSLAMAAYPTSFTWNAATGSSVNLFNLTDTASNTGTGYVFTVATAASSAAKPVRFTGSGTANGVEMTTAGIFQAIGSGGILATTGDSATAFFSAGQIEAARGGTGIDSSGSTGVPRVSGGTWSVNAGISHLASSTSADLRGTLSDETGTGAAVFAGGNIGAATATSINGLTITNSTGTLTVANGKTLTYNNSVALSGTDATTMTFPAATTTLAGLGIAQTFTAPQTINPGTTPADGLLLDIAALGGAGQRDSHNLVFRGRSNNGSGHTAEWKQFVDVTSNAGASQFIIGSNLDGGSFTNWLTIADTGDVSLGNIIGSSATFGADVNADILNATTSLAVTGTSTMREIDPEADNTYDLGTTSMRWKTLHVGPGSVVVHNDTTNTLKATLGFSGSTAQLVTDSATSLQLKTGSNNGFFLNTNGTIGYNLTTSTSGNVDFRQLANGDTILNLRRATDTSPTGNAIRYQTAAGTDLFLIDTTGTMTVGTVPTARLSGAVSASNMPALTGDVTTVAGNVATTIASDAVTFAKFQNITDNRLLGRSAGSTGDMQEITTGSSLTLSGGSLGVATGGVTNAMLVNQSVTIGSTSVNLGATASTVAGLTLTSPTIAKIGNLTTNGFVKTSAGDGTLIIDTNTYLTANQTITLSGDVTGSGTTSITATVANVPDSALSVNVPLLNGPNTFTGVQSFTSDDATNNNFVTLLDIQHSTSGSPAIGLGASLRFGLESSTTVNRDAARINTQWTTVTDGSRTANMTFQLVNAGTLATKATLDGSGNFTITGTFSGGGSSLTSLNAGNISSGTVAAARGGTGTDTSATTGMPYVAAGSWGFVANAGSSSEYLINSSGALISRRKTFNILAYGAVCDGSTTNDRAAIQAAIDAAALAGGGTVSFEGCTSGARIDTGLTIGDGSGTYSTGSATASTYGDIEIDGANTKLRWYGSAGGTVFTVNGPIYRLKVRDLFINMKPSTNAAGIALDLNHPLLSEFSNIFINENSDYAIRLRAYGGWSGGDGANGNIFDGVTISSVTAGAKGIDIGYTAVCSGCTLDPAQNIFRNFRARFDTAPSMYVSGSIGINLNYTDASQFDNPIIAAATALKITVPTGTGGDSYPAGYLFNNPALTGTASFTVSGTWNAVEGIGFNNYLVGDAQTIPTHAKVYGTTSNGVRFNQKADTGYISGLQLEWVSTTQVKIKAGSAQIQSTGEIVTLGSDSTISPSLSASAWRYCYLYLSSGTPTVECVSTAPDAPWFGTARSQTSATGKRYIGAIRTNGSSQIYNFFHNPNSGYYQWLEDTTASPFRVGSSLTATTETSVDCTAVAPATARQIQLRTINTSTPTGNVFVRAASGGANALTVRVNADLITPMTVTTGQLFYYLYNVAPSGAFFADVIGFFDLR